MPEKHGKNISHSHDIIMEVRNATLEDKFNFQAANFHFHDLDLHSNGGENW